MVILMIVALLTTVAAWLATARQAAIRAAAERAGTYRELRQWQERAERERSHAVHLERELTSWTEGCRQGREDVASIVPMLLAAQRAHSCDCVMMSASDT